MAKKAKAASSKSAPAVKNAKAERTQDHHAKPADKGTRLATLRTAQAPKEAKNQPAKKAAPSAERARRARRGSTPALGAASAARAASAPMAAEDGAPALIAPPPVAPKLDLVAAEAPIEACAETPATSAADQAVPTAAAGEACDEPADRAATAAGGVRRPAGRGRWISERDPRLPRVGTILTKRTATGVVRCECEVVEGGFLYEGKLYRSISAAAAAAARDLGLESKAQNGYTFWGLSQPGRRASDDTSPLARAWERYYARLRELVQAAGTDEERDCVSTLARRHRLELSSLLSERADERAAQAEPAGGTERSPAPV